MFVGSNNNALVEDNDNAFVVKSFRIDLEASSALVSFVVSAVFNTVEVIVLGTRLGVCSVVVEDIAAWVVIGEEIDVIFCVVVGLTAIDEDDSWVDFVSCFIDDDDSDVVTIGIIGISDDFVVVVAVTDIGVDVFCIVLVLVVVLLVFLDESTTDDGMVVARIDAF